MKFNLKRYISSPDALKGGLLASLFGLLPTIGLGAEYLFINVTHGIDFATDGRLGEGRISGMISVLNINTLWLPLTGFLLLNRPAQTCRCGNTLNHLVYRTTV